MAARIYPALRVPSEVVDLRRLQSRDLEPLLSEEIAVWSTDLDWDFTKSADLVRRFVDMRSLSGAALVEDGEAVGYAYYVIEDEKALIGDIYVRRNWRTPEREEALLDCCMEGIAAQAGVRRVESQVMTLERPAGRALPGPGVSQIFERNFMRAEIADTALAAGMVRRLCYIEKWSSLYQDAAAHLIAAAYAGHVDGGINDQYRTPAGARRFLRNIVLYPGCGQFCDLASFAAFDARDGRMCGISLASLVSETCGHITQICVSPAARGSGIGHELLRQSLLSLQRLDCRAVSLTVTASNAGAVRLYERMGFRTVKRFSALVWDFE
ncbi:MAG TPA: GNAT family N-acetyltransferase [Bryobacteraceae bacterium]|nr:GNAT family N-acetyltransferase [Bryobacteraceae bacterium]